MTEEILLSRSVDAEMEEASVNARKSFNIFWRELSWEMRRIVPGLDMSVVKRGFPTNEKSNLSLEHMWVGDISFDGKIVRGNLLNQPNQIDNLNQGDSVEFDYEEISDWMYSINNNVYGAFTVNVLRSRMSKKELKEHDDAWGLNFGDPSNINIDRDLSFGKFLLTPSIELPEHPMSLNMTEKSEDGIREMGQQINDHSTLGMTMLQFESLAGNLTQVKLLLKYGAEKRIKNVRGETAQDLAEFFNWTKISTVLSS
jgi:uncharacterized protein YegJ (DUF2314 family)